MPAKRILILTNRVPYPLNDGGNLAMHAMVNGYRQSGWDVCLLSMNTSRHYITPDQQKNIYTDIHSFDTVDVDNRVKSIPAIANFLFSNKPNHVMRFTSKAYARQLKQKIDTFKPDIIQVESIFLSGYLAEIKTWTTARLVLRMHNIEYQIWQRLAREHKNFLKHFYLKNLSERIKKYEEWAWQQYDILLPITDSDAAIVQASYPSVTTITVPFGINVSELSGASREVLWEGYHIGAMDWMPNQEAILWFLNKVWPLLHKNVPEFRFYFAGRHMPPSFMQMNKEGVVCAGEVPDADAFIADKKILIVPLRSGGGIRVKILEAMAKGKVVVSTDVGMQGIEAVPGIHYLKANTAEEFTSKINWCLANKDKAEQLAIAAMELIKERYNNRMIMDDLSRKLRQLL